MSKFDSKAKVLTLTALIASTAIVTYASQENTKTDEVNVDVAKLIVDKVDKDTVKVSVDNVNNSAKAFQLSLKVDGNAEFIEENINWLTNNKIDENGETIVDATVVNTAKLSNNGKNLDIFVAGDNELQREGSLIEVCEIDLNKTGVTKNSTYKVMPNTENGKIAYKSIDENNKSLEVGSMDETGLVDLSFNTAPTISLKPNLDSPQTIGEKTTNNTPVIDATNNIITINEGYEFNAKSFVDVHDEDEQLGVDNIKVFNINENGSNGSEITEPLNSLKSGNHKIRYTVADTSGDTNSNTASIDVSINVIPEVWTTSPTLTGVPTQDVTIYTSDIFDPFTPDGTNKVEAKDAKDNILEVTLDGELDLSTAGTYPLAYIAKDRFDNTTSKSFNLIVVQDNAPIIDGVNDVVINKGEDFDPLQGITPKDDKTNVTIDDIKVTGSVNTNVAGEYKLGYELSDGRNTTRKQRIVRVNGGPSISGDLSYMIIKNGQSLTNEQILNGITANDDIDGDVTSSLSVNRGNLDTSKDGNYTVTITTTDSTNLTSSVTRDIIVSSKNVVDLPESGDGSTVDKSIKKQVIDESAITSINTKLSDLTRDNEVTLTKTTLGGNVIYNIKVSPNKIAFRQNVNEYFVDMTVPKAIDDKTGGIKVQQQESIKVSSITVSDNNAEMKIGENRVLNTTIVPENAANKELLWTSTNNEVVSIIPSSNTQSATINGLKKGTSTIRVMATDGSQVYKELVVQVGEQPKEDTIAPVFDYKGKTDVVLANGMNFETPVVTASDNVDTGIVVNTSITDSNGLNIDKIDTTIAGEYTIKYTAKDKSDNKAELVINITVKEAISGIEVGNGNATSNNALEIKVPTQVSALENLLDEIKADKYQPKVYGNPVIDEAKNEATYTIKLYKKQNLFARLFNLNKNEEVYYLKLTVKNTDEFKVVLDKLEVENSLTDISGHWAEKQIKEFIELGHIEGYPDNTFRPNDSISRAEFVKIVNKVFNLTTKENENFTDVSIEQWYYNDICIAVEAGYIDGYGDSTFRPNEDMTREEASKVVASLIDLKYDGTLNFKDKDEVAPWAKDFVDELSDNKIIEGYDDNTFRPKSKITRAESVMILSRASK